MASAPISNNSTVCLAIDVMGGDNAPHVIIEGTNLFLKKSASRFFLFFGDQDKIIPILNKFPKLKSRVKIIHTKDYISSV